MRGDKAEAAARSAEQERDELAALEAQRAQQTQTLREQVNCQESLLFTSHHWDNTAYSGSSPPDAQELWTLCSSSTELTFCCAAGRAKAAAG